MNADTYNNNYFDIQDIMATQERMQSKFEVDIPNMGFLDSSSHDKNLKAGSKIDLPFWIVKSIYNNKFKFISIDLPKSYKDFTHQILLADPCVVDFRKMGAYYYKVGLLLVELIEYDLGQNISRILLWCFQNRFRRIMDLSCQTDHRDLYKAITKFDHTELEIYKAGQADAIGFLKWQRREFCKLQASFIISANKNKRKRQNSGDEATAAGNGGSSSNANMMVTNTTTAIRG